MSATESVNATSSSSSSTTITAAAAAASTGSKPVVKLPAVVEKEHRVPNTIYRRAILQALESLHDFHSRSNIDAVRRHTQAIITDYYFNDTASLSSSSSANNNDAFAQHQPSWNDTLFLKTLKDIVNAGEVEICAQIQAELSPSFKRRRADSLSKLQPPLPPLTIVEPHRVIISSSPPKEPPHRPKEHEKWKITPKRVFDKTTIVNPMDTH